jgi:predicted O-linked N-acetylglucosamine transferase (SPINDLY family)
MHSDQDLNARFEHARQLQLSGQFTAAYHAYQILLCLLPGNHALIGLMGTCLTQDNQHTRAMKWLRRAIALSPSHVASHSNLGNALKDEGQAEKAMHCYQNALILQPNHEDAHSNRCLALLKLQQPELALTTIHRAIAINPMQALFFINQGNVFRQIKQWSQALQGYEQAQQIDPENADVYLNKSSLFHEMLRYDEVINETRIALLLQPGSSDAFLTQGNCLIENRDFRKAMVAYEKAYRIKGELSGVLTAILYCAEKQLDWKNVSQQLALSKESLAIEKSVGTPLPLLSAIDDPNLHREAADHFVEQFRIPHEPLPARLTQRSGRKIRLGYFSSDFREHPVFQNLRPLLANHDREQFELYAFDFSPVSDDSIHTLFDRVVDITNLNDARVASLARSLDIDIAIDLNGHTQFSRVGIFSYRAAPIQINFLGYPGTMGGNSHDFIISDHYVIPEGMETHYSEGCAYLPMFFMPYDFSVDSTIHATSPSRCQYGLPSDRFVFCSFNEFHKITQEVFDSWARILRMAPDSVFWIALRGDISLNQIQDLFEARGVCRDRIIPAERVESEHEHLRRLGLADLMLDTFPYNSHTTACDAVKAGLPLLTLSGVSFASRVSGSLLSELDLGELIARDYKAYEEKAVQLAKASENLMSVRQRLQRGVARMPSPKTYAQQMETLLVSLSTGQPQEL